MSKIGKYKTYQVLWTWDPPTVVNAHICWLHPDDVSREEPGPATAVVDHIVEMEEMSFYIYRQFMLEAGYVARYVWYKKFKQTNFTSR